MNLFFATLALLVSLGAHAAEPHGSKVPLSGHEVAEREIDSSPRPTEYVFDVTAEARPFFEEFVNHPQIAMYTPTEISD